MKVRVKTVKCYLVPKTHNNEFNVFVLVSRYGVALMLTLENVNYSQRRSVQA